MQDKYVGDVGDFGKYALLRAMQKEPGLSLGVVWYLVNPDHTDGKHQVNDGKHVGYLGGTGKPDMGLRKQDQELFDCLRSIVEKKKRNIQSIEGGGVLTSNTAYFNDLVSKSKADRASYKEYRERWANAALKSVEGKDIVFLDPDNGLASDKRNGGKREDAKCILRSELAKFWGDGKRVVVLYHHLSKAEKHDAQIIRLMGEIEVRLNNALVLPLRYRRGSSRVYFVIVPKDNKAEQWRNLLHEFIKPWPDKSFECKCDLCEKSK